MILLTCSEVVISMMDYQKPVGIYYGNFSCQSELENLALGQDRSHVAQKEFPNECHSKM